MKYRRRLGSLILGILSHLQFDDSFVLLANSLARSVILSSNCKGLRMPKGSFPPPICISFFFHFCIHINFFFHFFILGLFNVSEQIISKSEKMKQQEGRREVQKMNQTAKKCFTYPQLKHLFLFISFFELLTLFHLFHFCAAFCKLP